MAVTRAQQDFGRSTLKIEARNIRKAGNSFWCIVEVTGCNIHVVDDRNFNRRLMSRHRCNAHSAKREPWQSTLVAGPV
jgi:hypothetical protein